MRQKTSAFKDAVNNFIQERIFELQCDLNNITPDCYKKPAELKTNDITDF